AGDACQPRLATEVAPGADLASDPGHLACKGVELVDHDVDGVLQLADLAVDVDGDLLGEIPAGDGGCHVGNIADLVGQVAGHEVGVVGEVVPDASHAADLAVAAQVALGAELRAHARRLRGE